MLAEENVIAMYLHVASAALFVFDFLLTLGQEVELIWGQPHSLATLLFLVNRYLTFLHSAALLSSNHVSPTRNTPLTHQKVLNLADSLPHTSKHVEGAVNRRRDSRRGRRFGRLRGLAQVIEDSGKRKLNWVR